MGKALVLRNVNFATNKLGTVTFSNPVPCTGISLSSNTISFTKLGTATITATLTPSDTTDQLAWATSDDTVATVANGVVTAVGLGSATITATCGNQSATCSISVEVVLGINDVETFLHKTQSISANDLANGKDYMGTYGTDAEVYQKYALVFSDTPTQYKAFSGENEAYDNTYVFMIPNNATKIEIAATGLSITILSYTNSEQQPTYALSGKGTRLVAMGTQTYLANGKCTNTIPSGVEGLDSFVATVIFSEAIEALPSDITITFKEE